MEKKQVGAVWNLIADLGTGRQLSVSWNTNEDASKEEANAEVDKFVAVINRQQAKAGAIGLEQTIDHMITSKKQIIDTLGKIDAKSDAKGLSAAERNQRDMALTNLENLTIDIAAKQAMLQKTLDEAK